MDEPLLAYCRGNVSHSRLASAWGTPATVQTSPAPDTSGLGQRRSGGPDGPNGADEPDGSDGPEMLGGVPPWHGEVHESASCAQPRTAHSAASATHRNTATDSPSATKADVLVGCGGDCVLRRTVVSLWQQCKRAHGWPTIASTLLPQHSTAASRPSHAGAAAREEGSALHLAARWGAAWEVEALVLASSAANLTNLANLAGQLRPAGPLALTPAHEAAIHADCDVFAALLQSVRRVAGPDAVAQLLEEPDAYGRTPADLIDAARPATSSCLSTAMREALEGSVRAAQPPPRERRELVSVIAVESALASLEANEAAATSTTPVATTRTTPVASDTTSATSATRAEANRRVEADVNAERRAQALGLRMGRDGWFEFGDARMDSPRCDVDVWDVSVPRHARRAGRRTADAPTLAAQRAASLHLGARFVRDAVSLDRPVLLRGLLDDRAVSRDWSRAAVWRRAGAESFQVMQYDAPSRSLRDPHTWRRVRLSEWLVEMREPPAVTTKASALPEYIFDQSGAGRQGALGRSIRRLFPWRALLHAEAPGLYVGANGSGNPFHYHAQTWNALVAGRKRWLLYPPNASFYSEIHPLEWLRRRPHGHDADDAALECEQRAGDVLFVPRLWGHGTINFGEAVGVAVPFALREGVDYEGATRLVT